MLFTFKEDRSNKYFRNSLLQSTWRWYLLQNTYLNWERVDIQIFFYFNKTPGIIYKEEFCRRKYFNFCIVIIHFDSEGMNHYFKFNLCYPYWLVEIHSIIAIKISITVISCGAYMLGTHPEPPFSHNILEYYSSV